MMSTLSGWFSGSTIDDILSVADLEPLGPIAWNKLRLCYPNLQEVFLEKPTKLAELLAPAQITALNERATNVEVGKRLLKSKEIGLLLYGDKNYPRLLKEIPDPPLWLFYRGNLKALRRASVSVVGSRKVSGYGKAVIDSLFPDKILSQLTTISGLAYGVDKLIHQASLACQQPTVGVLAGGLDAIYPVDHHSMAEKIIATGGLLLSEYPPLSRPRPYRFPVRNRIIAGLSRLTVVVEAAIKSGSLTTAKSALDYNRDIFAIPGDITRVNSEGTNFLISQGATLFASPRQLARYFGLRSSRKNTALDSELQSILELVSDDSLSLDNLTAVTDRPIEVVLALVTQLELLGMLYQPQPGLYRKK